MPRLNRKGHRLHERRGGDPRKGHAHHALSGPGVSQHPLGPALLQPPGSGRGLIPGKGNPLPSKLGLSDLLSYLPGLLGPQWAQIASSLPGFLQSQGSFGGFSGALGPSSIPPQPSAPPTSSGSSTPIVVPATSFQSSTQSPPRSLSA